jgi:CPA2 family monovalent cation:H+ antiporter-2
MLGLGLSAAEVELLSDSATVSTLAEFGVVFLLFDIGLHFSLKHMRERPAISSGSGRFRCWARRWGSH